jgi:hypothetical protein
MPIPELKPGVQLANLITACETFCVHDCCGIDAFHFSPLHIASHMSWHSGEIAAHDIHVVAEQLTALVSEAEKLEPNERGIVCSIAGTNELFSLAKLQALAARIGWALQSAPTVLAMSDGLERSYSANTEARGA